MAIVSLASLAGGVAILAPTPAGQASATASPSISGVVSERAVDNAIQMVDGEVRAISEVGNHIVAGGTFTAVGPAIRGAAGVVDLAGTQNFQAGFPDVVGSVLVAIPDGAGGYWIGGNFTSVGGQPRTNLAHVAFDLTVDPAFAPTLDAPVKAIVVSGSSLIVGGQFTTINGASAQSVAALDVSGTLVWAGTATGPVFSLALSSDGSRLFAGGDFTAYGGVGTNKRLIGLVATTGARDAGFSPGVVNLAVRDMVVQGSNLWLAGDFNKVGTTTRTRLAVVDAATGALGVPTAAPNGTVRSIALDAAGTTVYLGGEFTRIGTTNINGFAGVSASTGALTTTPLALTGTVFDVVLDGIGGAYLGGNFVTTPEKTSPRTLAYIPLSTLVPASVVPPASLPLSLARQPIEFSGVRSLVLVGTSLLVGGDFSDYGTITRPYLVSWDKTTGAIDLGFDAQLNNAVRTLDGSPDGNSVFAGGDFTTAAGATADRVVKLSMTNGSRDTTFTTSVDAYVKEIVVHPDGNRVFIGGNFRFTNNVVTERFVGVNATTGAILPGYMIDLTDPTNLVSEGGVRAMSLSPDGNRLAIIGNFKTVEGLPRPLATILDISDPASAAVTGWTTQVYTQPCAGGRVGWMRDVAFSPDGTRLVIVNSGHFYYRACDSVNLYDATGNGDTQPLWTARPGDTIESVAYTPDAIYLGGHFRYLDWEHQTDGRFQLGALNPATGRPLSWNPAANGFRGVLVLEAEPSGLYMGGDNTAVGGVAHGGTARFTWPNKPWLRRSVDHHIVLAGGDNLTVTLNVTNSGATNLNLTTYTDSLSGNVTSQGTCAPTTVAPGATFTCNYPQAVPVLPTETLTTVTTTIVGDNGAAITLSDRTIIRSLTAYLGADIRSVVGPVNAPYPASPVKWSVTMWNDNELVPMQITALTSTLHGDLNGQGTCVTPQTVAPYSMYQCMYDGVVSGAIGTTVTNQFKMDYVRSGVPAIDRHSTSVVMSRPADGGQILMVVGNATAISDADVKLRDRFTQIGFTAVLVDDDVATAADATGKLMVWLSTTTDPVKVGTKFASVPVAVTTASVALYDEMGLSNAIDTGSVTVTSLTVATPLHPLASPQVGSIPVVSSARPMYYGVPAASAAVINTATTANGERPSEFVYQPGALLVDGITPAPACRMAYPAEKTSIAKWTTQMYAFFDRAIRWAVYGCGNGIISTVSGAGGASSTGNGGPATVAGLNDPFGIATDSSGGFYVAEIGGNRVRYVNAAGIINQFAGTGTAGSSGDGGQAASATLRGPARVKIDPQGRVVIVDSGNNKIRRVDTNGIITTIAGNGAAGFSGDNGQATAAKLNGPQDVAWDSAGNMYIADRSNQRIRKVATTGVITTVAGNGTAGYNGDGITALTARLQNPYGVAYGPDGLLIADFDNNRVRLVNAAGIIQTVAGTGLATASGDGGPATLADLHKPVCLVIRPAGGYLICDYNNNRVRYVDADGVISTIVGVGTAGFGGDGDLARFALGNRFSSAAALPNGDLLVIDRFNHRVRVDVKGA